MNAQILVYLAMEAMEYREDIGGENEQHRALSSLALSVQSAGLAEGVWKHGPPITKSLTCPSRCPDLALKFLQWALPSATFLCKGLEV